MRSGEVMSEVLRLSDERATYLARGEAELANLVAQDGDFNFSSLPGGRVRSLYETGRWWEREGMPGVARLRQQVMDGTVDYFMYARDSSWGDLSVRSRVCFVPENCIGGAQVRHFLESPAGLARAPGELLTGANVESAVHGLRFDLLNGVPAALAGHRGMRWYSMPVWLNNYLVSGERYRDGNVLGRYGIRRLNEMGVGASHPRFRLDELGRALFELLGYSGARWLNPLRLLPSMRVPERWSECYQGGRFVSSFLVADRGMLEHLNGFGR